MRASEPSEAARASTRERAVTLGLCALLVVLALFQTSHLVTRSVEELASSGVAIDDAYFYAVIAENLRTLGTLTFDGSMPTNGVQPLWLALLTALSAIAPGVPVMKLSYWASFLCFGGFVFVAARVVFTSHLAAPAVSAAVLGALVTSNPDFQTTVLKGLETPLLLLCLVGWVRFVDRVSEERRATLVTACVVALSSGLVFLARTDWFWVVPLGLHAVWRAGRPRDSTLAYAAVCGAIVVPYVSYNWVVFGHPMPISGRVKLFLMNLDGVGPASYFASDEWKGVFSLLARLLGVDLRIAIVLVAAAVAAGFVLAPRLPLALRYFLAAAGLHAAFMHVVYREVRPYTDYYFAPEMLAFALICLAGFERVVALVPRLRRRVETVASALVVVLALVGGLRPLLGSPSPKREAEVRLWTERLALAKELRALPEETRLAAYWPGLFAYFSGRPILPLDGIVGSEWYFRNVVRPQRELDHAREHGITHVIAYAPDPERLRAPVAPRPGSWAGAGTLRVWQYCAYIGSDVAHYRPLGTNRIWHLYELYREPKNAAQCPGR